MKKFLCITLIFVMMLSSIMTVSAEENLWIVKPQYDEIIGSDETGTIICVSKDDKYGYIDNNGKVIIDLLYDAATVFNNNLAYVEKNNEKYYINKSGKMVFSLKTSNYLNGLKHTDENKQEYLYGSQFYGKYAYVRSSFGDSFIIDDKGKSVELDSDLTLQDFPIVNGIAVVGKKNHMGYGYLNIETKKTDINYYLVSGFENGLGIVDYGNGYIQVLNDKFTYATEKIYIGNGYGQLSGNYINVYISDDNFNLISSYLIDFSGKIIIPEDYAYLGKYKENLIVASKNQNNENKYGYIDINNKWIIKANYNKASDFKNGIAIVSEDFNKEAQKGTFGIINTSGQYLLKPQFEEIKFDEKSNLVYVKDNGKWGLLNKTNLKVDNKPTVTADEPENWAKAEVEKAINNNLVPKNLQNKYKEKITRKEFCELVVSLIEVKTGKSIDDILFEKGLSLSENSFTDTSDKVVIAANKLGIVNGKGNGIFATNGYITRQEAAVMLTNTAKVFEIDTKASESTFADKLIIASWAKSSVDYVSSINVMKGTNKGFEPNSNYTRQQAYITIHRLAETITVKEYTINPDDYDVSGVVVDDFGNPLKGVSVGFYEIKSENGKVSFPYSSFIKTDKNGVYAFNKPDKTKEYKISFYESIIDDVLYTIDFRINYSIDSKKIVMHRTYSVEVTSIDTNGESLQGELRLKIISDVTYKDYGAPGQINNHYTSYAEEKVLVYYYTDVVEIKNPIAYVECNGMKGELSFSFEKGDYRIKRITVTVK